MSKRFEQIWMANKHMKLCSTALDIREKEIKTTVRYHHVPIRMTKMKKTDYTQYERGGGATHTLEYCW